MMGRPNELYIQKLLEMVNSSPFPTHLPFRLVSIGLNEARVEDGDGRLVAHGTSTLMALPGKAIQLGVKKFLES